MKDKLTNECLVGEDTHRVPELGNKRNIVGSFMLMNHWDFPNSFYIGPDDQMSRLY